MSWRPRKRQNQELIEVRHLLEGENRRLQQKMTEREQDARTYIVPQPAMHTVVDDLPRHPTLRYERRPLSTDHAFGRSSHRDAAVDGAAKDCRATRGS